MSERKRIRRWKELQVTDLLRGRILSGVHSGHLNAGDRAPAYREVADETGLDLRAITRIYEALEREGLVEVRGRQGVFIARQERLGGRVLEETARWVVGILNEAWLRRIELPHFPEFIRNCIATTEVRSVCIESTVDQLEGMCGELNQVFGLRTTALHADRLVQMQHCIRGGDRIPSDLQEAHFLVTTAFHAAAVRGIAEALEKPLVVVTLNPDYVRTVERELARRELTVICVDPRFLERFRLVIGGDHAERIRGVLVEDEEAVSSLSPDVPVLISHAARARRPDLHIPSVVPAGPVLARESAEELTELLVRFNVEAMREES